jgi:hypothetical protein
MQNGAEATEIMAPLPGWDLAAGAADTRSAFAVLRQIARSRRPAERCDLCSAAIPEAHPHLIHVPARQILCACDACATVFDCAAGGKYRRVSRQVQFLSAFRMTDQLWENLLIPINLAFFFHSSTENRVVALYPSPAGAVESLLSIDAWTEIVQENPALVGLRPDIEALLVNRVGHAHGVARAEHYIAPIDECFRLVGLIRSSWKGLSGGAQAWTEIGQFFSRLRACAEVVGEANA